MQNKLHFIAMLVKLKVITTTVLYFRLKVYLQYISKTNVNRRRVYNSLGTEIMILCLISYMAS